MSLKSFHLLFITISSLLAFGCGVWAWRVAGSPALALGAFLAGGLLIAYGVWFRRKVRSKEEEQEERRSRFRAVPALCAVALLAGRDAAACAVCFGEAQGPMIDAARLGVWLLFGLIFCVQLALAWFFFQLWRRARALQRGEAE